MLSGSENKWCGIESYPQRGYILRMEIGKLIGRYREKKNLSKRKASTLLGKSLTSWISIEGGRAHPQLATLIEIGKLLGFEVGIHAFDQSYGLNVKQDRVITEEKNVTLHLRRLDRLLAELDADQLQLACNILGSAFPVAEKKRSGKTG